MFGINSSKDKLTKLNKNYELLKRKASDVSLAELVCSEAWHINDWVYCELIESGKDITKNEYRNTLYLSCPEFKIMHDIANTIKHKHISKPKVTIVSTKEHSGTFDYTFDRSFDISFIELVFEDGSKQRLLDVLKPIIKYWNEEIL